MNGRKKKSAYAWTFSKDTARIEHETIRHVAGEMVKGLATPAAVHQRPVRY